LQSINLEDVFNKEKEVEINKLRDAYKKRKQQMASDSLIDNANLNHIFKELSLETKKT
jgi:hypothetical protein